MFLNMDVLQGGVDSTSPNSKLEDHPLSAVHDCLFNLFAATLHIGGRSCIRNLRTRHAVVTGTHYTWTQRILVISIKNSETCFGSIEPSSGQIQDAVSCIWPDDGPIEPKHVAEFLILITNIYVVLLTK